MDMFFWAPIQLRTHGFFGEKIQRQKKGRWERCFGLGTNFECSRNVVQFWDVYCSSLHFRGCWQSPSVHPPRSVLWALSSRCNDLGFGMVSKAVAKVSLTAMDGHERQVDYHEKDDVSTDVMPSTVINILGSKRLIIRITPLALNIAVTKMKLPWLTPALQPVPNLPGTRFSAWPQASAPFSCPGLPTAKSSIPWRRRSVKGDSWAHQKSWLVGGWTNSCEKY